MTPAKLAEIKAACETPTCGEWKQERRSPNRICIIGRGPVISGIIATVETDWMHEDQQNEQIANAHFIANSRQWIPELLSHIEFLELQLGIYKQQIKMRDEEDK